MSGPIWPQRVHVKRNTNPRKVICTLLLGTQTGTYWFCLDTLSLLSISLLCVVSLCESLEICHVTQYHGTIDI